MKAGHWSGGVLRQALFVKIFLNLGLRRIASDDSGLVRGPGRVVGKTGEVVIPFRFQDETNCVMVGSWL